ncbi:MAG: glycosyltransferase family 9 protein [Ignavibacteria bacterium]|nr:glycosyltransferase family 9 protein [Ignavibacteria bacterium]
MDRKSLFRKIDKYAGIPLLAFLTVLLKRKRNFPAFDMRKILVVKFAAIGDSIMLIPMLRTLRRAYPDAEITFLCSDINVSIIKKIPYIDNFLAENIHSYLRNPFGFIRLVFGLRKNRYSVIIDTEQWSRFSAILISLLRYDFTIGFKTEGQYKHFIFDRVIEHSKSRHELETFIDLLIPLFVTIYPSDYVLEYFLTEENEKFGEQFFIQYGLKGKTVIAFHPGCGGKGQPREWEIENYVNLGKRLMEYNKEIILLISGAPHEKVKCSELESGLRETYGDTEKILNISGQYSLDDVVAIIKRVTLVVCSNTGILHLASCVGTKTMGLHGPTNPQKWGAYSPNTVLIQSDKYCSPCLYLGHDYGCKSPTCMTHISVDDVFIHIRKALNPELFPIELKVLHR